MTIDVNAITFVDEPVPLRKEDYTDFIARYLKRVKTVPQVKAVYQYGNTDYDLGISDLDLLMVLEGSFSNGIQEKISMRTLPSRSRVLMRNETSFYSRKLFEENILTAHWDRFDLLYGKPFSRRLLPSTERVAYEVAYHLDRLGSNLISLAVRRLSKRWRILPTLGILSHVAHDLRSFQRLSGEAIEGSNRYIQDIHFLRRNWFALDSKKYEKLVSLVDQAALLETDLSFCLQSRMKEWGFFQDAPEFLRILSTDEGPILAFVDSPKRKEGNLGELSERVVYLPNIFYAHAAFYLEESRGLCHLLSKQLGVTEDPEGAQRIIGPYRTYLKKRGEALAERFQFIRENRLSATERGIEGAWWGRVKEVQSSIGAFFLQQIKRRMRNVFS